MTRRGSLAYYLAGWICGCFFMTVCVWLTEIWRSTESPLWLHGASGLLFAYFYGLILGVVPTVANGFILRRAMKFVGWKGAAEWIVAGAIALLVVVVVLAAVSRALATRGHQESVGMLLLFRGAELLLAAGWWLAIPAGAATGLVLHRIDKAFSVAANSQEGKTT